MFKPTNANDIYTRPLTISATQPNSHHNETCHFPCRLMIHFSCEVIPSMFPYKVLASSVNTLSKQLTSIRIKQVPVVIL